MLKELELWMFKTLTGLFLLEPLQWTSLLPIKVHPVTQPGPHPVTPGNIMINYQISLVFFVFYYVSFTCLICSQRTCSLCHFNLKLKTNAGALSHE